MTACGTRLDTSTSQPGLGTIALTLAFALALTFGLNSPEQAQTFAVLHKFNHQGDGAAPDAGVIRDAKGDLYGTTGAGGSFDYGTVFMIQANGKEVVLHSFT